MIELSADLGEGSPEEPDIWPLIDAANVACGGHTGDRASMAHAVSEAATRGVRLGAHPSYPDRDHFGRRSLEISAAALHESLVSQLNELVAIAAEKSIRVERVKPHGALYNDAHVDECLAAVIVAAIRDVDPAMQLVAPHRSGMSVAARAAGLAVIREVFADRRYTSDGALVSRSTAGALLAVGDAVTQSLLLVKDGEVVAIDGTRVVLPFDTLCIHADMDEAAERLRAIRQALGR